METDRLIRTLAETARPVRPLPPPLASAALWLALSIPYIALVVYVVSPRPDLAAKFGEMRFAIEQSAALATAIAAAAAAFAATIPGYSRKMLALPAFPLALWLGALGQGCVEDWLQFGAGDLRMRPDWFCLPAIVLVGTVPALAMAVMLRRGAPLMPGGAVALGGLAAAAIGNVGLRLFHAQDASLMVLVWQVGSVFALAGLASCLGRYILNWDSIIASARRRAAVR